MILRGKEYYNPHLKNNSVLGIGVEVEKFYLGFSELSLLTDLCTKRDEENY